jgi:hypothetical protein
VKLTLTLEGSALPARLTAAVSALISSAVVMYVSSTSGTDGTNALVLASITCYGHLTAFLAGSRG